MKLSILALFSIILLFSVTGGVVLFANPAEKIDGETILVSSPEVPSPMAVRYTWASNPVCNFYNKAGLPASPFRTDSWRGITEGNK